MILFEIDIGCFAVDEPECDPPRAVDGNGITLWFSLQAVKVPAGQIHVLGYRRFVERIEQAKAFALLIGTNLGAGSYPKKIAQSFMPPAINHITLYLLERRLSTKRLQLINFKSALGGIRQGLS